MTENGNSTSNQDEWRKLSGQKTEAEKTAIRKQFNYKEVTAPQTVFEPPTDLNQVEVNLAELKNFMDYRGTEGGASRWEYYQDKGMSFDDALSSFVQHKTSNSVQSIVATMFSQQKN